MSGLKKKDTQTAVAPVIGFLLVTAIVIVAAVQYQNNVVPNREQDAETSHFSQVGKELAGVQSGVIKASTTGKIQSQTVQMGVDYRIPGITPPAVQGSLSTINTSRQLKIKNAQNNRGASNFWSGNGAPKKYDMTFLEYNVNYNRVQRIPTIGSEYGMLYSNFSKAGRNNTYIMRSDQSVVNDRTINLYTTTGDMSVSTDTSSTVQMRPVSAPTNTISISDNGTSNNANRIKIRMPSQLPARVWRNKILEEQIDNPNGCRLEAQPCQFEEGFVAGINDTSGNTIEIVMEKGKTYNLRMSRIHYSSRLSSSDIPQTDASYVSWRGAQGINIREGETLTIDAQARDKYNNGVLGERVIAEASYVSNNQCAGDFSIEADSVSPNCDNVNGNVQPGVELSDTNGISSFVYTAPQTKNDRRISFSLFLD